MTIQELFDKTIENNASDLHVLAGVPPTLRIDGKLVALPYPPLTNADIELLIDSIVTKPQK